MVVCVVDVDEVDYRGDGVEDIIAIINSCLGNCSYLYWGGCSCCYYGHSSCHRAYHKTHSYCYKRNLSSDRPVYAPHSSFTDDQDGHSLCCCFLSKNPPSNRSEHSKNSSIDILGAQLSFKNSFLFGLSFWQMYLIARHTFVLVYLFVSCLYRDSSKCRFQDVLCTFSSVLPVISLNPSTKSVKTTSC